MRGSRSVVRTDVRVYDLSGGLIQEFAPGVPASVERTLIMQNDRVRKVLGNGRSKVSVSISDKLSGEDYSSVSVYVQVTIQCGQDSDTIHEAGVVAFEEAVGIIDDVMPAAVEGLRNYIKKYGR